MNQKRLILISLSILSGAVVILLISARSVAALPGTPLVPPNPQNYFGRVTINGTNVVLDTVVSAWCGGVQSASTKVYPETGETRYYLDVLGDNPDTPVKDGCSPLETVSFMIGTVQADQTGTWVEGGQNDNFHLNATVVVGPNRYSGDVSVNGANVPLDTVVSAWCGGVQEATAQVTLPGANTRYQLDVPGDVPSTLSKEGCTPGEMVSFKIGAVLADQTDTWTEGGLDANFNLTATVATEKKVYVPLVRR